MFSRLRRLFKSSASPAAAAPSLAFDPTSVAPLLAWADDLPRVDWSLANSWIATHTPDGHTFANARRALMAACLDEMRTALPSPHARWRSANVEGLAPERNSIRNNLAKTAEHSFRVLTRDLAVIRGKPPIPPIAIIAVEPQKWYLNLINSYHPDEGEFATSGGIYVAGDADEFPLIAISSAGTAGTETTVAHELTHHALRGFNLPLWVEEGLTQMMEERVVGFSAFALNAEFAARHRNHWHEHGLESFLDGSAFFSPEGDTQELAYHLAQWIVRSELTRRPDAFFQFIRACRTDDPTDACSKVLRVEPDELVAQVIGLGST